MSYLVLARKWRPQAFDDVTGQEHVVQTLANAIAQDRVAHAFLLCGPRGVGKTTTARLLARALNCANGPTAEPCGTCQPCREIVAGSSVDVVEIDGASNNGVDNVRELREAARYLPQRDRHKVFIIDEVHMLSVAAFNALLKTLEEPPPHVKFIFATTDPQKLPDTILSRCQRHNFRRVPADKMVGRLRSICDQEGITISDRALQLVARQADGGMRDALSLLDQLLSSAGLQIEDGAVEEALGLVDRTVVHAVTDALLDRDGKRVIELLAGVYERGFDPKRFCEELAQHLRDLVYVKAVGAPPGDRGDVEQKLLTEQAQKADAAQITRLFELVHHAIRELSYAPQPRLALEVALLSAVHLAPAQSLSDLAARLEALASGVAAAGPSMAAAAHAPAAPMPAATATAAAAAAAMRPPAARAPTAPMAAPPAGRPAPQAPPRPQAMSAEDLVKQVEALTRGRAAPRQAGAKGPGRGTPTAGGDEEPHGAPSRFAQPPAPRPFGSTGAGPAGAGAPARGSAPQNGPYGGPPQSGPFGGPQQNGPHGGPQQARGPMGPGPAALQPPMHTPAQPGRPVATPQRAPVRTPPASFEPPPWGDDDEPPPPGDEFAPPDEDGLLARPLEVDTSPGGCATGECLADEPAPPPVPPQRPSFAPPVPPQRPSFAPPVQPQRQPAAPATGPAAAPFAPRPAPAAPAPAAAAACAPETYDDPGSEAHERWRLAVAEVRKRSPIVGSFLSEGRLLWLRPGEVALGFIPAKGFHKAQLEGSFSRQADELLSGWFNRPTKLKLLEASADAPASVADEQRKARDDRARRLREEAREHPAVLAVQSILGGEIDDIEVLEER